MLKKVLVVLFLTTVVSTIYMRVMNSTRSEGIHVGDGIPYLTFRNSAGAVETVSNDSLKVIVCLFHSECSHCKRQLESFDANIDQMNEVKLILLSDEDDLFMKVKGAYTRLQDTAVVKWGIVDRREFEKIFGKNGTPATYFFSEGGKMISRFRGEVSFARIRELL